MKKLTRESHGEKLLLQFEKLIERLKPLENDTYEKRPFIYFDIISWLESKISNQPLGSIIKQKQLSKTKTSNPYKYSKTSDKIYLEI